jgi:DNA-binding Lrp family transcriptional regulator
MFPTPSQVLRQRDGTLADTPFPLLLHSLMVEERTCTLELKVRQREKRIVFEDGAPVGCQSNLLHETLGKYLVEKGKLAEADYQKTLAESVSSGLQMGALLIQKGLISPFDLYKQLQANLAHKLLDCFRWTDAKYRLIADVETPDASVRMNTAQLILTGVANVMPFDAVATHFTFTDERRFGQMPGVDAGLKLSSKDARLFQALRQRPTFNELLERTGFDTETVLRRLYALCQLEVSGFAEDVDERAAKLSAAMPTTPAPVPVPVETPAPVPVAQQPQGTPFSDEDEAARNALVSAFLAHRSKDPFTLLEVPEDVQPVPLRKAFFAWADRHSPLRFQTPELREKAEALLAAYAKAFGALSDAEQNLLWRKRRAAQREKERGSNRPSTAEQFRIRTDLLDASTQFDEAKRRLDARNFAGAFEYFEYACDIDPKPLYKAHRAFARYLMKPEAHGRLVLQELQDVVRQEPGMEEGWAFLGEVAQGEAQWPLAEDAFRKAFKLNPKNRRYVELIQEIVKRR